MSHWQTGKLDLICSLNILRKALINLMPEWEEHIQIDENGGLSASFHEKPVKEKYQIVVPGSNREIPKLYNDIAMTRTKDGSWTLGGDYSINTLKKKLTGEVMRMRAIAIAQIRGYDVVRNENNETENITEIRVDVEQAKELLA